MDSRQPPKTSSPFEYFLYAAIFAETALAAIVYKVIFHDPDLAKMQIVFAIFYFAFLAWAIAQLHSLHRDRTTAAAQVIEESESVPQDADANPPGARPLLGLSGAQLVIVVVVFATAVVTFSLALRLFS